MPNTQNSGLMGRFPDKVSLLRTHPLFQGLPLQVTEHLSAYLKTRSVSRGTIIFMKGDPGTGLMGVLSGAVKISVASTEGRDIVLNIIREGDIFGEIALLDGHPRTANATAISECELVILERREFIPFLRSHPDAALKVMQTLCSRLRRTSEQVHDVSFLTLPIRLAKVLLQLSANTTACTAAPKLAFTQREIGEIVGRSRESTNKQLREWADLGWIRLEWGRITLLKPDILAEVATKGL